MTVFILLYVVLCNIARFHMYNVTDVRLPQLMQVNCMLKSMHLTKNLKSDISPSNFSPKQPHSETVTALAYCYSSFVANLFLLNGGIKQRIALIK
jgi:hypothetical protein